MSALPYICWGDDQTNLTEVVETFIGETDVVVLEKFRSKRLSPKLPRIVVTCPSGHENVFTVGGGVGVPPTDRDKVWTQAMNELTPPTKGLEAIGRHAQFIFGSVTVFASLLTGLGVVSDFKVPLGRLWLVGIPVSLLALSLALTAFAMTPGLADLRSRDLTSFEETLTARLRKGGRLIRSAGIALSFALLSIIPIYIFLVQPSEGIYVRPSFTLTPQPDASSSLSVGADISGARRGMTAELVLVGTDKKVPHSLLTQKLAAGWDGTFSTIADIPKADRFQEFKLQTTVYEGTAAVHCDRAVFKP